MIGLVTLQSRANCSLLSIPLQCPIIPSHQMLTASCIQFAEQGRLRDGDCAGRFSGYAVAYRMSAYNKKPRMRRMGVAKTRLCLKCREPFESEWSGERVCKHCKSLNSWREATTSTSEYEVSGRR